jgi:cytidylate kinase
MAVITISRQFGAGGITLGERLSKRLGYRYVHEDIIGEVARKMGTSPHRVRALERRGGTKLKKLLDKVDKDHIKPSESDRSGHRDEYEYVDAVRALIEDLCEQGNVVIIGRGGQHILRDKEDTCHVLLVGDINHRVRFIMENYNLSEPEALSAVKRADEARTRFLSLFSQCETPDDPLHYDLVLNMNRISLEAAEELVFSRIRYGVFNKGEKQT